MHFARLSSHSRLGSATLGAVALVGCSDPDSAQESIASTSLALTTATARLQDGTNGYLGTSDTQISQDAPNTNYGASTALLADGDEPAFSGKDSYALLRWDVSSIPAAATVSAASLTFGVTNASAGGYSIYALRRSWSESSATWNLASSASSWQTPGAQDSLDRDPTAIGTLTARSTGYATLSLTSYGVSVVNGWVDDPTRNFGLLVANSNNSDGLRVSSSEYSTVSNRPTLAVTYSVEDGRGGTGGASSGGSGNAGTGGGGTGGVGTGGVGTGGVGTGGVGAQPFGFFVWSDSHVTSRSSLLQTAMAQVPLIDSAPIGAFSTGDFTNTATSSEWDAHIQIVSSRFDPAASVFGPRPRYLGMLGNHDTSGSSWYAYWASHMTGQGTLGHSGADGIFYSLSYQNVLFVAQDSEHVSGPGESYSDAQSVALATALAGSTAQFKFMFFHQPVYACNSTHPGLASGLPWLDLAEKHNVDAVFTGHTHVYTRTCRMKHAACTTDGTGTVQVETGTVGGSPRPVNVISATVSGTDSDGAPRTDTYNCTSNLQAARGSVNDFCHVRIDGSRATITCYTVASGNATPFDTWVIDHG